MLFDEIDKSMDILNIFYLYSEILPKLIKETGIQIIMVSHSPLVLLNKIRENINFISVDEKYTDECLKLVNQFK
jgi:predicted ATPase